MNDDQLDKGNNNDSEIRMMYIKYKYIWEGIVIIRNMFKLHKSPNWCCDRILVQ